MQHNSSTRQRAGQVDYIDMAWLAGWLEGEGWFQARVVGQSATFAVTASTTDHDVALRAQEIAGGNVGGPYENKSGIKPYWIWNITNRAGAVDLATTILPYMGKRRTEQIDAMLELHNTRAVRRVLLVNEEPAHGTTVRYLSRRWKCRCSDCRAAIAEKSRKQRAAMKERTLARDGVAGFRDL